MNVTNSIVDFFQGSPFNNPVGSFIEKATDSKNEVENWTLFMEICDIINSMEDGPRLAIRAIKRLLTTDVMNNTTTVLYTLVLLETCVKNCGYRFHLVVCTRDFLQELEKLVLGTSISKQIRNDVPVVVRDRVLVLIQTWFNSFKRQPDLREIESTYIYLHECGVQFPTKNISVMSPIDTPRKVNTTPSKSPQEVSKSTPPFTVGMEAESHTTPIPDNLVDKLSKNLSTVQGNIDVLSELMQDYPPSVNVPDDIISLMKNLESISQQMQLRLVDLVNKWDEVDEKDGSVLFNLLTVNDEMNNALIQYERYERARTSQLNKNVSREILLDDMSLANVSDVHGLQDDTIDGFFKSKHSKDDKGGSTLPHSSNEVEHLISKSVNVEENTSLSTALTSQEFDEFLTEQAQNSFSINGDVAGSSERKHPFSTKHRDVPKERLDM